MTCIVHNTSENSIKFRLFRPKLRFRTLYYFDLNEANDVYYFVQEPMTMGGCSLNVPLSS